ncbi:hypothetical protein J7M22_18090 [Candidatus Poribacteria bacterium]|nr:hypothetical protein [Candidatus Poribacteria bacterium]
MGAFLILSLLLAGAEGRFLVFWCPWPDELKHATHITPQVWVEGDEGAKRRYLRFSQKFWLERGVLPLRWMGGVCYKDKPEGWFVSYWSGAFKIGYRGIAIDEFGSGDESVDEKMARALVRTKELCPELFIAVWHAGGLNEVLARAYRRGADLVMLEAYVGGKKGFEKLFSQKVEAARRFGIVSKTILALGINDRAEERYRRQWGEWANSEEELETQVRWIRENAPDMPGVAFFASSASRRLVLFADKLCGDDLRETRSDDERGY